MRLASNLEIQNTPVWNEVKNWNDEDKVNLITLLSVSLADKKSVETKDVAAEKSETEAEKTKRMLEKYVGCWEGDETAEEIIRNIYESRRSRSEPIKFDD